MRTGGHAFALAGVPEPFLHGQRFPGERSRLVPRRLAPEGQARAQPCHRRYPGRLRVPRCGTMRIRQPGRAYIGPQAPNRQMKLAIRDVQSGWREEAR